MKRRSFLVVGAACILAGCMGGSNSEPVTKAPSAFTVNKVSVSFAKGATVKGRFSNEALRNSVLAKVGATATAKILPGGPQKARALVSVTAMQLKEPGNRTFGGVNSMTGQMTIVSSSGKVIQGPIPVYYADQAKNSQVEINGLPIGMLINASRNAEDAKSGADVNRLIVGFADEIVSKF